MDLKKYFRAQDHKDLLNDRQFWTPLWLQKVLAWMIICAALVLFWNHLLGSHMAAAPPGQPFHTLTFLHTAKYAPPATRNQKTSTALHTWEAFAGEWVIAYSNGFQTTYMINPDGKVVATVDDGTAGTGHLSMDPNATDTSFSKYMIKNIYSAPKYEKVKLLSSGRMLIEHWIGGQFCCRAVGMRKNGPSSDHVGQCVDDLSFVDEKGLHCVKWRGYDCTAAHSVWGYSVHGKDQVLQKCAGTCTVCEVALAEGMLHQIEEQKQRMQDPGQSQVEKPLRSGATISIGEFVQGIRSSP